MTTTTTTKEEDVDNDYNTSLRQKTTTNYEFE